MDSWQSIGAAILLGVVVLFLFPQLKKSMRSTSEATAEDWKSFLIPILAVVGFVILLIMMV